MSRSSVSVRPATPEDLPALMAFGEEMREQLLVGDAGRRSSPPPVAREALEARYLDAIADDDRHLVLAVGEDGGPLGMALFVVAAANALLDLPCVHVNHVVVPDRHRRRGAGRALVAAAATFAEERDLDQVVVSVNPASREANRFFARLGFAPLAVRRVAPVAALRRRLAVGEPHPTDHVARRRPRRPAALRPRSRVPLGPADGDADPLPE